MCDVVSEQENNKPGVCMCMCLKVEIKVLGSSQIASHMHVGAAGASKRGEFTEQTRFGRLK